MQCINVIIDKSKAKRDDYPVLENALTYSVQRIENDSAGKWKRLILSDRGRVGVMSHTVRKIRAFNPIPSMFGEAYRNQPIRNMVVVQACAQMGHADVSTTLRIYTHLDAIHKRKSVDKLDACLSGKSETRKATNS